jgi:ribonuclease P/MRP protein subunit POP1
MITKWGYRLPLTPTAKCHRPSHRAAHNGCIIGDVSYFSVIQLEGSVRDLRGCLSGVVGGSGWAGSRWVFQGSIGEQDGTAESGFYDGDRYENGTRMGKTVLYRYKQWPFAMIGPVEILWQPTPTPTRSTMGTEPMKKVWIRFHPGMFEEAWESIRTGVQGWYQQGTSSYLPESGSGSGPEGNEGKRGIRMKDLRGELCVFELMGPRSVLVLKGVLGLVKDQQVGGSSEDKGEEAEGMDVEQDEQKEEKDGREKKRFWNGMKSVQSSGQLSRGMVVGLKVHDPRLRWV